MEESGTQPEAQGDQDLPTTMPLVGGPRGGKRGPGPPEGMGDGPVLSHSQQRQRKGWSASGHKTPGLHQGPDRNKEAPRTDGLRREKEDRDAEWGNGGLPPLFSPWIPLRAFRSAGTDHGGGQGGAPSS